MHKRIALKGVLKFTFESGSEQCGRHTPARIW